MPELIRIFVDVLLPVFGVAAVGYIATRIAHLDHRSIGTLAFWVLAPAFIFNTLRDPSALEGPVLGMMATTILTVSIVWLLTWLLLRGREATRRGIDPLAAAMGNVGNLGFPIVLFALGDAALPSAVVHFVATTVCLFGYGVTAGARLRSGSAVEAVRRVVTTPAILAVPLGFIVAATEWTLPTAPDRLISLLADAMIPVMLLTLGMQLATSHLAAGWRRLGLITLVKLVVTPIVFAGVAAALDLTGVARDSGLVLAAMPTAVLVALIGVEFDMEAEVASAAVLVTSVIAMGTLSVVLALV